MVVRFVRGKWQGAIGEPLWARFVVISTAATVVLIVFARVTSSRNVREGRGDCDADLGTAPA